MARIAELQEANSKFCNAVAMWAIQYEDELDKCDEQAKKWKDRGDMYGWNFYEGMRSGWIGNDIALSKLKDLAHEHTGRELARSVAIANKPNIGSQTQPPSTNQL